MDKDSPMAILEDTEEPPKDDGPEEEREPEAQAESQEEPDGAEAEQEEGQEEEPERQPQQVPLNTLLEERRQRQAAEQRFKTLEERQNKILEHLEESRKPEPPKPEDDPFGAIAHDMGTLRKELQSIREGQEKTREQTEAQVQAQQTQQYVASLEQQFRQQEPEYDNAVKFLMDSRMEEYRTMGYDDQTAQQVFNQEAQQVVSNALNQGRNPAEVAFQLARTRGYKAPKEQQKTTPKRGLKEIAQDAEESKSLSGTSGKSGKDEVSAEDLAEMSEQEFNDWLDKQKDPERAFSRALSS